MEGFMPLERVIFNSLYEKFRGSNFNRLNVLQIVRISANEDLNYVNSLVLDMERRNIFPIDKSYLTFNLKCLTALGGWNPYEGGPKYWIYQIYTMYFVIILTLMRLLSTLVRTIDATTLTKFLREFSVFIVQPCNSAKSINLLFHRIEVLELLELFNWERYLLCSSQVCRYRDKIVNDAMRTSKIFTISFMLSLVQYFSFYFQTELDGTNYTISDLPISAPPMRYCFILANFYQSLLCDFVAYTLIGINAVCHDSFILSLMINIATQLKILNFRLERCHMTKITSKEVELSDDLGIMHFECYGKKITDQCIIIDPNEEFVNCIKYHQQILSMLNTFIKIYNKVLLPQLLISLLVITVSGLQIILMTTGNFSDTLVPGGFLMAAVIELAVFCWGGNIILVESDKIRDSIYSSEWYNMDKIFRNNLNIFLGAVKNPSVVTAGGLFQLSAITFQNVLAKAYSGMAVLKKTNA